LQHLSVHRLSEKQSAGIDLSFRRVHSDNSHPSIDK
jgi:hypothetical protein